jgi:hypothetical protein
MLAEATEQVPEVESFGGLFTSSYWKAPRRMVAVRVSLGVPKGLDRELEELPVAFPWGLLDIADREEFEARYRARLEGRKDRVLRDVRRLRERHPGVDVVLCCWEPLTKSDQWCHRRMLAVLLEEWTGEEVPEYPQAVDNRGQGGANQVK